MLGAAYEAESQIDAINILHHKDEDVEYESEISSLWIYWHPIKGKQEKYISFLYLLFCLHHVFQTLDRNISPLCLMK